MEGDPRGSVLGKYMARPTIIMQRAGSQQLRSASGANFEEYPRPGRHNLRGFLAT